MKILPALASLAFALSLSAAPTFAHDADSMEITHKGADKACCKKKHDERCEKDSAFAVDSAQCAKMDKEQCRKHREHCMKDSTAASAKTPAKTSAKTSAKTKK